jgi:N-acetylglucosamine kinase-like BadF-type ATPase
MDIGRDGLALSLQMADGRQAETPLRIALWRSLELDPADPQAPQRIKALVVAPGFGPAGFARMAPVVNRLAEKGDRQAAEILQTNAEALARMAAAVARALGLEAPPVSVMGGAIENLAMFRGCFMEALAASLPDGRPVAVRGDACDGALAMAAELLW